MTINFEQIRALNEASQALISSTEAVRTATQVQIRNDELAARYRRAATAPFLDQYRVREDRDSASAAVRARTITITNAVGVRSWLLNEGNPTSIIQEAIDRSVEEQTIYLRDQRSGTALISGGTQPRITVNLSNAGPLTIDGTIHLPPYVRMEGGHIINGMSVDTSGVQIFPVETGTSMRDGVQLELERMNFDMAQHSTLGNNLVGAAEQLTPNVVRANSFLKPSDIVAMFEKLRLKVSLDKTIDDEISVNIQIVMDNPDGSSTVLLEDESSLDL